jgi:xanthine dehydrogenase FAD-binding subunit
MYLPDFKFHKPSTLSEALAFLSGSANSAAIAGGTDVLVEMKNGIRHNDELISLSEIHELKIIEEDEDKLILGAAVTHNEIINSRIVKEIFPVLAETAKGIGTHQIRNTGTIGGNLCTGASCCDMAPTLAAAGASLEIISSTGKRIVSIKDFFIHHKKTLMEKGEILTKIIIPAMKKGEGISFKKFGLRNAASISVASAAVKVSTDGDVITASTVVMGAVAPTPVLSLSASKIITGEKISSVQENNSLLEKFQEAVRSDTFPIDDIRGSAHFRGELVKSLSKQTLIEALNKGIESFKN